MRTLRQTIEGMALVLDPEAAGDLEATIQFNVTGDEPGTYRLGISGGECTFGVGPAAGADLTVHTPADVWREISEGRTSGQDALLAGRYEVEGDASLLMRMDRLFSRPVDEAVEPAPDRRRPGPIRLSGSRWMTVAFIPWLFLWFGPLFGLDISASLRVAFPLAAVLAAYHAVYGRATWFETGSALFLGLGAAASLTPLGRTALAGWGGAADTLALGIIWLSSLLHAPRPLSADYSRWDHAGSLEANSTFLHVNLMLTFMWGAVFVTMGCLSVAAMQWPEASGELAIVRGLLLIPAIVATIRLPRIASRLRFENMDGWRRRTQLAALTGTFVAVTVAVTAALSF